MKQCFPTRKMKRHKTPPSRTIIKDGPDPIDVQVGSRIRLARILAGVGQQELGRAIGVSFQALQKYENGENRVSASRLYAIAQALDQPVVFFFAGAQEFAANGEAPPLTTEELQLVRSLRQIPDKTVRDGVLQLIKRLAEREARASSA